MLKRALIQQFKFTQFTVLKNLEGVTHKESLTGPDPAGNCANWVLGHIVWSRGLIHKLIGEKQSLHEEKAAFYQRGGEPIGEGSGAVVALEELLGAFISSHATLKTALEEMSEERYGAPKPEGWDSPGGDSIGEQLAALAFHEAYHAGQLGMIRRITGKKDCLT